MEERDLNQLLLDFQALQREHKDYVARYNALKRKYKTLKHNLMNLVAKLVPTKEIKDYFNNI